MEPRTTYRLWSELRSSWCDYEVVGEYYHTDAIQLLFPTSWNRQGEELLRDVELVPEPDNPYGEWAISVRADGLVLGYIAHADSQAWAGVVRRITASGLTAITNGRIYLYEAPDWDNVDRHGNPRTELRSRISIKLGNPEFALPLNDPPSVPYTLVPRSSIVQVTKEDKHFDALHDYVPRSGRGPLYLTLHPHIVATTRTAKTVVEVRIDDRPVGQLTPQMSQRFLPMIQHLEARGLVTACWGDITGSSVAAEVRLDAVKANEVDDSVLNGPPLTEPILVPAMDDPRAYLIPGGYTGDAKGTLPVTPVPKDPVEAEPVPPDVRRRGSSRTLLIAALVLGGFFSVLIPYVGPIVWLASWGASVFLVIRWIRISAQTDNAVERARPG